MKQQIPRDRVLIKIKILNISNLHLFVIAADSKMIVKVLVVLIGLIAVCRAGDKTQDDKQTRSMTMFASKCPPGLWCGKKRSLALSKLKQMQQLGEEEDQNDETPKAVAQRSMSNFASKCPPGLWCGKKRSVPSRFQERPEIPIDEEAMQNQQQPIVNKNVYRRFMDNCPPGLWCGKKRSLASRFVAKCPPGLWCGK